ncbi:MAG: hypothetical protein ABIQ40_07720 [Bacteroidia bacterium]
MKKKSGILFLFLLFIGISLQAFAFNPKKKSITDDIISGKDNVADGNDVKLPIGLPFSINDAAGTGSSSDEKGADSKIVYTFDLPDGQGPESYHETHSAFEQARSMNASCVLIRMSSMSGALNAAENISFEITDYDRPVMVYVNDKAIPASTLISMAADNKKNASNAKQHKQSFGEKNPIGQSRQNPTQTRRIPRDEKNCTGMSSILSMTKHFTTGQNGDLDDVLTQAGLNNYTVVHYSAGFFAQVIDWCMKPFVSLLLIILIAFGLRTQLSTVFPGPATFLLLVTLPLFGIPLFVGGLAGVGEFGLLVFLAAGILITGRKKSSASIFRFVAAFLFIVALTLCQSENFSTMSDWKVPFLTFMLTSITFAAGWFLTSFIPKFLPLPSDRIAKTA